MTSFPEPGWRDVADILILSYLAHRIIVLFRGTRAPQVLLPLAALWMLWEVADRFGLELTGWFLGGLSELAAIALVVVFRNEIREVLVRSSPFRLLAGRPTRARAVEVPELVDAVFRLARTHTGALIVLQRRDNLDELAREGTSIDAIFHPSLIDSFFCKDSPVHDGALILDNGRIDRVGTILPLSTRPGLPDEYGTRHRAAVGLSERCDAVVLVVSEERGEVSVVRQGVVTPITTPMELESRLNQDLRVKRESENRHRWVGEFATTFAGYLLTVLAVTGIWAFYNRQDAAQRTLTASVNFRGLPESLELVNPPESIDLHLRGNRTLIDGLLPQQVSVSVDMSGAERGGTYAIERGDLSVTLPAGVEWSLADSTLRVELIQWVVRPFPVRPRLEGKLPPDLEIKSARVNPAQVSIRIPEGLAAQIEAVATRPIDVATLGLGGAKLEATVDVPLELGRISGRPAEGSSDTVRVTVIAQGTGPPAENGPNP